MTQDLPMWARRIFAAGTFFALAIASPYAIANEAADSASQSESVPASLVQIPISSNFYSPYAFVVDKSARLLTVWQQSPMGLKKVANFPADLGKSTGEKKARGDHKTPEGIYFLLERREGETLNFSLYGKRAFTTDYPNFFDRFDGKTGDGIWLHAVPDHVPLTRGSRGCVVVRNEVILDISQYVKLGRTPILIHDQIDMIAQKDLVKVNADLVQWLENWRMAWETKTLDSYIEYYSPEFRSMAMNKNQWRSYKDRLNKSYKSIAVRISKPAIFADRKHAIVRFLQEYRSDKHSDVGEKTLYLKRSPDGFKIVGEQWSEDSSEIARQEIEATKNTTALSCTANDTGPGCARPEPPARAAN